jgi:hypothetical protein
MFPVHTSRTVNTFSAGGDTVTLSGQCAPRPRNTGPIVFHMIMKSNISDLFATYRTSMRTESSQERSDRPLTCQRPVRPGLTRNRRCLQRLEQGGLVQGHRVLCPSARTIGVVSLPITRGPLYVVLHATGTRTYTTSGDVTSPSPSERHLCDRADEDLQI